MIGSSVHMHAGGCIYRERQHVIAKILCMNHRHLDLHDITCICVCVWGVCVCVGGGGAVYSMTIRQ